MGRRTWWLGVVWLVVLGLVLAACATPTPQVIKETVVVTKEVEKVVTKEIPTLTVIGPWAGAEMDQFTPGVGGRGGKTRH